MGQRPLYLTSGPTTSSLRRMDQPGLPPLLPGAEPPQVVISRWRWWVHLMILAAYPIVLGIAGALMSSDQSPMLPSDPLQLMSGISAEIFIFTVVFIFAWIASRASAENLRLPWNSGIKPITRGFIYAIGLQLAVMLLGVILKALVAAVSGGQTATVDKMQPEYEKLVDPHALVTKPIYLWLNITLVSFGMGGLREELWRSGMLAGFAGIAPKLCRSQSGQVLAICLTALAFGLGHIAQGWGGVVLTALLGVALGLIMMWHRTIWTAVFAHGFFDAVSFFLLFLAAKYFPEQLHKMG
ncbi:MAG TPA: CPBP family intramembrane glutamic endopeptidase [Candidatus Saccharimonadales bacterium]|nr:CPBP family intramembrane glutamic endopeptidase [Candidatus Saccharimonadales bacterium]